MENRTTTLVDFFKMNQQKQDPKKSAAHLQEEKREGNNVEEFKLFFEKAQKKCC